MVVCYPAGSDHQEMSGPLKWCLQTEFLPSRSHCRNHENQTIWCNSGEILWTLWPQFHVLLRGRKYCVFNESLDRPGPAQTSSSCRLSVIPNQPGHSQSSYLWHQPFSVKSEDKSLELTLAAQTPTTTSGSPASRFPLCSGVVRNFRDLPLHDVTPTCTELPPRDRLD